MLEGYDPTVGDPYIVEIATLFLEGYEREMKNQDWMIDKLEDDTYRQLMALGDARHAQYFEGKTREELEANKTLVATSVGIGFAIRHTMRKGNFLQ